MPLFTRAHILIQNLSAQDDEKQGEEGRKSLAPPLQPIQTMQFDHMNHKKAPVLHRSEDKNKEKDAK